MMRFLAGAAAMLLLMTAGFFVWQGLAQREPSPIPPAPEAVADPLLPMAEPELRRRPATPPAADSRTREQRRFGRADKNDDGRITLAELYEPRRRAFAKLDKNGDGRLGFEEWAVRTSTKFGEADRNRDGALTPVEYATTAPRRRAQPRCACPQPAEGAAED